MGRIHQQMDPKMAASTIYGRLQSQGGVQPGRAYSTAYFQSLMPYPMYGFNDDWIWWQMVMGELNGLMLGGGYGFPAYAYDYGGMNSIYFGDPNDVAMMPQFYGDPMMNQGVPFDPGMGGGIVPPDFNPGYDPSQGFDPSQGVDPSFGGNDPNQGQDFSGQDQGGGFDQGGFDSGGDSGGAFDSGGDDSGGGFDLGGGDSGGGDF